MDTPDTELAGDAGTVAVIGIASQRPRRVVVAVAGTIRDRVALWLADPVRPKDVSNGTAMVLAGEGAEICSACTHLRELRG